MYWEASTANSVPARSTHMLAIWPSGHLAIWHADRQKSGLALGERV